MTHYFENDKNLKSDKHLIYVNINDKNLKFYVDYGVFSKKGLDFGTRTLLETLDLKKIKGKVLDFGCGYGPIGIYISKMCNVKMDMIDINLRSIELAKINARENNVDVNIFESNLYEKINDKYDFIITNPPIRVGKEILYKILTDAQKYLKEKGELWFVIHKDQGAKSTMKYLEKYYHIELVKKNKGFYIICARSR